MAGQEVLRVFHSGNTTLLIGLMVTGARGEREHLPPPFQQMPRAAVDVMKEFRDLVTRQTEVTNRIAKTVRVIRDQREPHSGLLTAIV